MDSYKNNMLLCAPAARVYDALTTQHGIAGWWTRSCEVGARVGELVRIKFGETFKVMRIESLRPQSEVRWNVVDAQLVVPGLTRTNEWIGTTILFQLSSPSESTTRLDLEHIGLTQQIECYEVCSQGWGQFLESLKSYVEKGKGSPYADPVS
ncbi:SRPBCC family protein [Gallaecimonas xiamenensis]|uniref:Activator of Hsp90 ATPase 1 family protein n=1 Tax=Gallaecimonas xiamenensis 3-C-1 TaxID=745411 RepID=K2JHV5_9GAMM|nr:SRPBCC domain-containing protein [Gallaecimonas xiamenensis]EKE70214.1 activator of Hsp90 ATPase 1 family protein [Gallaecimonas xiamenensis 3-C-1]